MTAPHRAPWFCDAIAGVERTFPGTAEDVRFLIDDLASTAELFPAWQIDSHHELPVTLAIIEHTPGQRLVVTATAGAVTATIMAEPDPSGWLKITAICAGITLIAYMDRPYEEYSLLPANSPLPPAPKNPATWANAAPGSAFTFPPGPNWRPWRPRAGSTWRWWSRGQPQALSEWLPTLGSLPTRGRETMLPAIPSR